VSRVLVIAVQQLTWRRETAKVRRGELDPESRQLGGLLSERSLTLSGTRAFGGAHGETGSYSRYRQGPTDGHFTKGFFHRMTHNLIHRLERAEEAATTQLKFSVECICFPETEQPFFNWRSEERIAAEVKCPLHGERFRHVTFSVYVSKWLREKQLHLLQNRRSDQYRKAWYSSFPPRSPGQ
jgi:hypothetical protein